MRNSTNQYTLTFAVIILSVTLFSPLMSQAAGQASLENRVERLERLMSSEKQSDLLARFNQLQQENQQLRNMLEEQSYQLQSLKKQQRDLYKDLTRRMNQMGKGDSRSSISSVSAASDAQQQQPVAVSSTAVKSSTSKPQTSSVIKPVSTVPSASAAVKSGGVEIIDKSIHVNGDESDEQAYIEPVSVPARPDVESAEPKSSVYVAQPMSAKERQAEQVAYQKAYDELRAQHYVKSRDSFSAFIQQYPHGRYAHIAQYWVAESSFAQKDYQQAILDYQHLIDFYPDSPKRIESQLKKAYCYNDLGNKEKARENLQLLIAQYPDSTEATQAKRLLKNL